ncbi:heme lyase CcmF/NrfE family subunit [Nocardioides sp. DS6]|uniref:Heme lyase CcmF/NrfE family subunit n=1 Tax=Nocardioides eburneus TaxID=3231482 RepID=A0ABV3T289_9ACTN
MTLISAIGLFFLALACCASFSTAVVAAWAGLSGRPEPLTRWGALATLVGAAGSVLTLEWALVTHDFAVRFVAENGSRSTPLYYTLTSLWSAHDGSLLLWCLVIAGYLAFLCRRMRGPLHAWAVCVVAAATAFFCCLAFATGGVFDHVDPVLHDGPGPTPLLQSNPAMGIHPPLLYLGLVGLVVPFAYAVAGLVTGRVGRDWRQAVAGPLRFAWVALTAGIVLGAWWSYAVLGWGGYWSWDPVENSSLMPWLLATALLHGLMVQRRTGALPVWNLSLAIGAFLLAATGVLLTRSGVVASVHSFADSGIGPVLLGFLVALVVGVVALVVLRVGRLAPPRSVGTPASRGGALLAGNLVLVALCATVLLGTVLPVLAEAAGRGQVSVGPPYYDRMAVPAVLVLLLLMVVGPLLRWRPEGRDDLARAVRRLAVPLAVGVAVVVVVRLTGHGGTAALLVFGLAGLLVTSAVVESVGDLRRRPAGRGPTSWLRRHRRTLAGRLAHVAFVVVAVGVAGSSAYASVGEVTLHRGRTTDVAGVAVRLDGVARSTEGGVRQTRARLDLDGEATTAALRYFPTHETTVAAPAILSGLGGDRYVTLLAAEQSGTTATIRLAVNPMVSWIWAGGALLVLGGILGARRPRRRPADEPVADSPEAPDALLPEPAGAP